MSIKRGGAWGDLVALPDGVAVAADDAAAAATLDASTEDPPTVLLTGGDLARTVGRTEGPAPRPGDEVRAFPIDLIDVRVDDDGPRVALAHVIAHRSWVRGGPWRGRVVAAMNAEFAGRFDVAPRGHPNDGRIEVFDVGSGDVVARTLAGVAAAAGGRAPPASRHRHSFGARHNTRIRAPTRASDRWRAGRLRVPGRTHGATRRGPRLRVSASSLFTASRNATTVR